jgi:hypothetical protein
MTTQEAKLVEYLNGQSVSMNNTILVDRNIVENSMTYLLKNGITIISLSFASFSDNGVDKTNSDYISYSEKPASIDKMLKDIQSVTAEYSHIEISIGLKKMP